MALSNLNTYQNICFSKESLKSKPLTHSENPTLPPANGVTTEHYSLKAKETPARTNEVLVPTILWVITLLLCLTWFATLLTWCLTWLVTLLTQLLTWLLSYFSHFPITKTQNKSS